MIILLYEHKNQPGIQEIGLAIENNSYEDCTVLPQWCVKLLKKTKDISYAHVNEEDINKFHHLNITKFPVILHIENDTIIAKYYLEDIILDDFDI